MSKDFINFLKAKYKGLEIIKGEKIFTINIEKLEKTFWEKYLVIHLLKIRKGF